MGYFIYICIVKLLNNIIMNTPVSFQIAKLLKEKGFDNESAHYYNEKGEMLLDIDFPSLQSTKPNVYYDNPTIAEVVMWLYEKHGIWITVFKISKFRDMGFIWSFSNDYNNAECDLYNSPTEAYSQAILYTLKNLI